MKTRNPVHLYKIQLQQIHGRSAHSRSSSASRFQSVGPPTTSGDEDMNMFEDNEEDDSNEMAPPLRQVHISDVCLIPSFLYHA